MALSAVPYIGGNMGESFAKIPKIRLAAYPSEKKEEKRRKMRGGKIEPRPKGGGTARDLVLVLQIGWKRMKR